MALNSGYDHRRGPAMKSIYDEFDLLLCAVDPIEGDLARGLLSERSIPSLLHGPDFDMAEFGRVGHSAVRHPDLFVPKGARGPAREILVEAWGEERVAKHDPRAN